MVRVARPLLIRTNNVISIVDVVISSHELSSKTSIVDHMV